VAYVGRDETADMTKLLQRLVTDVTVPLAIDSTEADVHRGGPQAAGGKCDHQLDQPRRRRGRLDRVCPLLNRYGAALIALTIDEDREGMAKTADRKLAIAARIYDLVPSGTASPQDLIFDPLTFTICTGNEDDRKLGPKRSRRIRGIKKCCPGRTSCWG
jgi:5-methyltetrahydrofolate--homocysteine methyltransferase